MIFFSWYLCHCNCLQVVYIELTISKPNCDCQIHVIIILILTLSVQMYYMQRACYNFIMLTAFVFYIIQPFNSSSKWYIYATLFHIVWTVCSMPKCAIRCIAMILDWSSKFWCNIVLTICRKLMSQWTEVEMITETCSEKCCEKLLHQT